MSARCSYRLLTGAVLLAMAATSSANDHQLTLEQVQRKDGLELGASPAQATMTVPLSGIPNAEQAERWLDQMPVVRQAQEAIQASRHSGAAIAASPHEWTVTAQGQRRNYRDAAERRSNEWNLQLERPFRINGKAGLDSKLGSIESEIALAKYGESRHEAALVLAGAWTDTLVAQGNLKVMREQLAFSESMHAAVSKRKRAGDASQMELNLAEADVVDMQRQVNLAELTLRKAEATLKSQFPEAQPNLDLVKQDGIPSWTEPAWRTRAISESDELKLAQAELTKAKLTADRVQADRVPDPTFGVYTGSEARRSERVYGVTMSIPLSGTYREQKMLQALKEVDVAQAEFDKRNQQLQIKLTQRWLDGSGARSRSAIITKNASLATENARMMQRAYTLGEVDFQASLLAKKQALDASRQALETRMDVFRSTLEQAIDAHWIWGLDQD
ncbi:TolC family protein [Comamonas sp. B-9]|uniref:TolC family protein n=1 Tax=Comamonas sp. B-9 TaxID=1055192 RepID=UPI000421841A|nr:TolC family protein [Comamonas sp. B-9]